MPAVIDRCGVIAGPWQMGKVDQGVFTHWMLAHHFGNPLSYIGFGGKGKQVRDLLHVEDLVDLVERQLLAPAEWDGRTVNVGGGRECSLSLLETTAICRELTGNEVPIEPVLETPAGGRAHIPFRLREALRLGRVATAAQRRAGACRHPRVDRGGRAADRPGAEYRRSGRLSGGTENLHSRLPFVTSCLQGSAIMEAMRQSWSDDRLDDLVVRVDRGFREVDTRFEHVDKRFEQVDKRFEQIDKRFEQVDKRFEQVDERFKQVDARFEGVQKEFVAVRKEMKEGFDGLQRLMIYVVLTLVSVMTAGFGSLAVLIVA